MLFSELAKRVAEKYPEVKTAYPKQIPGYRIQASSAAAG